MIPDDVLKTCARLCLLAYDDIGETRDEWDARFRFECRNHGFSQARTYSNSGVEAVSCFRNNTLYVAVRGTSTAWDQMRDLVASKVPCAFSHGAMVHKGFFNDAQRLLNQCGMLDAIHLASQAGSEIYLCGHSLGGATATILAAELLAHQIPVAGLVVLCSPRAGNDVFASMLSRELRGRLYHFTRCRDYVARTPPRRFGFEHIFPSIYVDSHGNQHWDAGKWFCRLDRWRQAILDFTKLRLFTAKSSSITHHSCEWMVEYILRHGLKL